MDHDSTGHRVARYLVILASTALRARANSSWYALSVPDTAKPHGITVQEDTQPEHVPTMAQQAPWRIELTDTAQQVIRYIRIGQRVALA